MIQQRINIVSIIDAEKVEHDRLSEDINHHDAYGFCSFTRASVERRIRLFLASLNCAVLSKITPNLFNDKLLGVPYE